jgi:4-hydroxy-tetrahydrodipicolinate reductase
MTLRIVQWTTGNVARQMVRQIDRRDDLELVGVFVHSADKVGVDAVVD